MGTKTSQTPSRDLYILSFINEFCHPNSNVNPFLHYDLNKNITFFVW